MPTVLITGANRGIGLEFVRQYAAEGWNGIACCRNLQKADQLQALAKAHKNIRIEALDVTDTKSIAALAAKLKDTPIDLLINNAGIYSGSGGDGSHFSSNNRDPSQTFGSLDAESWGRVLRTNAIAPLMVAQALMPSLTKSKNAKIVMITSRMGSIANAEEGDIAYRSSKAALNAAMHNIAMSLQSKSITVVAVHPGWVKTDMGGAYADMTPEQSVSALRKLIAELTLKQTGQFLRYNGESVPW
jgi:NAD(P)-dependent dehydrogenase (short-subunit alcohol dehydrogenase family)